MSPESDKPDDEGLTFMPRYLVERHLPAGVASALADDAMARIAAANRYAEVAWLYSYVTENGSMLCLYEADSPEAVRRASRRAGLPIEVIHRVTVLDPHGFRPPRQPADDMPAAHPSATTGNT